MKKCRLLLAVTPAGREMATPGLEAAFDLYPATTYEEALQALEDVDAILCSMHFADSRMIDLLREAKRRAPDTPFVCCQVISSSLRPGYVKRVETACETLGAAGFINYHRLCFEVGVAEANKRFPRQLSAILAPLVRCGCGS